MSAGLPPVASSPDADGRVRRLDSRLTVAAIFVVALGLLLWGEIRSPVPYTDPNFAVAYFGTELQLALFLSAITLLVLPRRHLGLQVPQGIRWRMVAPVLLLVGAALAAWVLTRRSVPAGVVIDDTLSWLRLRTTLLVGFNEEWLFRGLLPAALCRWWGLRRGAMASLLGFGAFHLMNAAAGVPLVQSLFQFCNTILLGSMFLLAAFGMRSLWLPMLAHALYDFAVIDIQALRAAGATSTAIEAVVGAALLLGIWGVFAVARLQGDRDPYASPRSALR